MEKREEIKDNKTVGNKNQQEDSATVHRGKPDMQTGFIKDPEHGEGDRNDSKEMDEINRE